MKRLLLAVVLVCSFAAIGSASADTTSTATLTLAASPSTLTLGEASTLSGTFSTDLEVAVDGRYVVLNAYEDAQCTTDVVWTSDDEEEGIWTADDGTYTYDVTSDTADTYGFTADVFGDDDTLLATSPCVTVTFTAETPEVVVPANPSTYLCWNREMVDPVDYLDSVADEMWATGRYFEPQAVLGNVQGGTNIGAYHLVCNAPTTLKPTGYGIGGSGEVYTPNEMKAYHHEHPGGNDLNVYHVYG